MSVSPAYALLANHPPDSLFAWWKGREVSTQHFIHHVQQVAAQLPEAGHAINLCEDRYLFLVSFVAVLLRRQVNLLPPHRARLVVEAVAADYPGSYCLVDRPLPDLALSQHIVTLDEGTHRSNEALPPVPSDQVAVVLFTSGSTGQARANTKHWAELHHGALNTLAALELEQEPMTVLATVPPQHMFGLELSVILPLVSHLSVHGGRPFFPEDLRSVLEAVGGNTVLVTTPIHLDSFIKSGLTWPGLGRVISATASLTDETRTRAEALFRCRVSEIYGSTETGAMAVRQRNDRGVWRLFPGMILRALGEKVQVSGGHLPQPVVINDLLRMMPDGRFRLEGRHSDMIKIAGKRASLGDLNLQLQSIPGVEDGIFVWKEGENDNHSRLAALVVAPHLDTKAVLAVLKDRLDPVFLPRPVYRVERLPRNETGKLPREAVLALLASMRNS